MTDFTDHQAALRKQNMESINYRAQMVNDYAPLGEDIIKPSRFGWMIWPAMGVFLGFIVVIGIASI